MARVGEARRRRGSDRHDRARRAQQLLDRDLNRETGERSPQAIVDAGPEHDVGLTLSVVHPAGSLGARLVHALAAIPRFRSPYSGWG